MVMPPMVGVPALEKWPSGPSSRICWPMPRAWRVRMRIGVPRMAASRAAAPAIEQCYQRRAPGQLTEDLGGDGAVVEGADVGAHDLGRLVALAGQDDDVAGLRRLQGQGDGGPAVGLDDERLGPAHAGPDLLGDGRGVLAAGVVGGEDGEVGHPGGDLAHQRALGPVPVATAAEDDQHPPGPGHAAGAGQGLLQGVGGVGVVDQHREGLAPVDRLVAAGHRRQVRQPGGHRRRRPHPARGRRPQRRGRWRRSPGRRGAAAPAHRPT